MPREVLSNMQREMVGILDISYFNFTGNLKKKEIQTLYYTVKVIAKANSATIHPVTVSTKDKFLKASI